MHDTQFRQLLDHFGYSWSGYRRVRKGVKKRLVRHMHAIGYPNVDAYIAAIKGDADLRHKFELCMTVSISRFFRDRGLWEILQSEILPILIQQRSQNLKIWSAGCASGEEVYSFRILWEQMRDLQKNLPSLEILATDMHPDYLRRARMAVYPRSSLREITDTTRNAFFEKHGRARYHLIPSLKEKIIWQVHDLLLNPPEDSFDLIFLRNNLLTYYADQIVYHAFSGIINHLVPGGFLVIGGHEKLPMGFNQLIPFGGTTTIFQRQLA